MTNNNKSADYFAIKIIDVMEYMIHHDIPMDKKTTTISEWKKLTALELSTKNRDLIRELKKNLGYNISSNGKQVSIGSSDIIKAYFNYAEFNSDCTAFTVGYIDMSQECNYKQNLYHLACKLADEQENLDTTYYRRKRTIEDDLIISTSIVDMM